MLSAKSQYRYFENLEKTIKVAIVSYAVVLFVGIGLIVLGVSVLWGDIEAGRYTTPLVFGSGLVLALIGAIYGINRVKGLNDIHGWLDERFFKLLEKSNRILFDGLIISLDPNEQFSVSNFPMERKQSLAHLVFIGLAEHDSLFKQLLISGIFRVWIWYWVMMYGTFVFTTLTIGSFVVMVLGLDSYTRVLFTTNWSLALLHFVLGILLGYRLLGKMRDISELLIQEHRNDIAVLLRSQLAEYEWS
jgi:hypothetical protein